MNDLHFVSKFNFAFANFRQQIKFRDKKTISSPRKTFSQHYTKIMISLDYHEQSIAHEPTSTQYDELKLNPIKWTLFQCQNYTQVQEFKFKGSLLSTALPRKDFEFHCEFQLRKINSKYVKILEDLERLVEEIKCDIELAKANEIRVINNVIQLYLKRTNTKDNYPVKQFKETVFEQHQKMLLEKLILSPFTTPTETEAQQLFIISKHIKQATQRAQKQLKKMVVFPEPTCDPKQLLNILNQCDIHLDHRYRKFENCGVQVEKVMRQALDGLNDYWNTLERIGAGLVMGVKSQKEKQLEIIIAKSEEKSLQILQYSDADFQTQPQSSFPYHSILPPKFPHIKLKPQSINRKLGQMSNKRRGKQSILHSGEKKMMQLISNWYVGVDKEEKYLSGEDLKRRSDLWSEFYSKEKGKIGEKHQVERKDDFIQNRAFNNNHEHSSRYPDTLSQLLARTYPNPGDVQSLYYFDQHPTSGFSLQHPLSNSMQARLIFQAWHDTELESQFYQISQLMAEKQNKVDKLQQKERRQADGYGIGFRKADRAEEKRMLERFVKEGFDEEFLPEVITWTDAEEEQEDQEVRFQYWQGTQKIDKSKVYEKLAQFSSKIKNSKLDQKAHSQSLGNNENAYKNKNQVARILNESTTTNQPSLSQSSLKKQEQAGSMYLDLPDKFSQELSHDPTLLSSLIECYFTNIQTKYTRLAREEKMHKTYYFLSGDKAQWELVCRDLRHFERVFLALQRPGVSLVRMEKLYNMHKEMIKCVVYMFGWDMKESDKEALKRQATSSLAQEYVVTFSFKTINTTEAGQTKNLQEQKPQTRPSILKYLPCNNLSQVQYLTGILTVLIYEEKFEASCYEPADFLIKGEELIKEYELFFLEDKENLVQSFNEFIKFDHSHYQKMAKINYVFDLQSEEGLAFEKLSTVALNKREQEKVDVFRAIKYNKKNKFDYEEQDVVIDEDSDEESDEDQGEDGRPIFVPLNRAYISSEDRVKGVEQQKKQNESKKDSATVNNPKKLNEQNYNKNSSEKQQQPSELIWNSSISILAQNKDGIKRSDSRQQLKNMKGENLLDELSYKDLATQQNSEVVRTELESREITVHDQFRDQDQYYEEDEEIIGL